jgi:site-specific DNA-methyltransferase (adenine-specific)
VGLFSRMLAGSAAPGMTVCDPFVGSGSSAVAALAAGCTMVAADIDCRAVATTRERCAAVAAGDADPGEVGARPLTG